MSSLLSLDGISKSFGYQKILENVTFNIESGEFVILVGNNGVGKSTLLRIISSLMRPTNGEIYFQGKKQKEILKHWLKQMGYVSEESRLYGDLSSIENLRLYGTFYETDDLNLVIKDILSQIDLAHVGKIPVRNFSSGMKKRLMIGRLMLYKPQLLLLDEPQIGLDQLSLNWFEKYLKDFHRKGGTVLMTTHQFEKGLELADRILVLHKKQIKHDLSTNDLNSKQLNKLMEE